MTLFQTKNAPVLEHYVDAFRRLQSHSWPDSTVEQTLGPAAFAAIARERQPAHFAAQLDALRAVYPTVRVFWKDLSLDYLGSCTAFASDAGVAGVDALIGLNDAHPDVVWSRQGAKYRRDDRKVMATRDVLLDVVERQDVEGDVRWLRTSKAPVFRDGDVLGIIGAFDIISIEEAKRLTAGQG